MKIPVIFFIALLLLSCENKEDENQPPWCAIIFPLKNAKYSFGDTVLITIEAHDPDGYIPRIQLYLNEYELASVKDTFYIERLETSDYPPGDQIIKAIATDWYGLESSDTRRITINPALFVKTVALMSLTETSAQFESAVSHDGGSAVTDRGVCWSTSSGSTIADSKTTDGSGTGSFTSTITGLGPGTTYYAKAYAINEIETKYGMEQRFKTYTGSVTDIDGNVYGTIQIGDQTWMGENLKTTHYPDGSAISLIEEKELWMEAQHAYCWYENDITNKDNYGALYNWPASMSVCPDGWHLPSDLEWMQLEIFLGMSQEEADQTGYRGTGDRGTGVGDKLKSSGTLLWNYKNLGATNESGFNALPGGYRSWYDGVFSYAGSADISRAYFWTSTERKEDVSQAWFRFLTARGTRVNRNPNVKMSGYSVRCVKDQP